MAEMLINKGKIKEIIIKKDIKFEIDHQVEKSTWWFLLLALAS